MKEERIGIILNGVTGRMGTNQHLVRSILAIIKQGGVELNDGVRLIPDPILTGRNEEKLSKLAAEYGIAKYSTDLDLVLKDPSYSIFFDASGTPYRIPFLEKAIAAGKHVYCEKPTAVAASEAYRIAEVAEAAGVKNGTVQDKLWLPGIMAYKKLRDEGFFGEIFSVRGEFGYWVFTGHDQDQPAQRPSWNYRQEDGGGIIIDMHCHWRYLIDNLFGEITEVFSHAATHVRERINESETPYSCSADDSVYAMFKTEAGIICQFNSSWNVRVRRDDLLTLQVDGSKGSALVGLRKCWAQSLENTPRPVWNPDVDSPIDYYDNWDVIDPGPCENAFKIQWELFLKHVARDEPFPWSLREGAKGVELAEKSWESHHKGKWVST